MLLTHTLTHMLLTHALAHMLVCTAHIHRHAHTGTSACLNLNTYAARYLHEHKATYSKIHVNIDAQRFKSVYARTHAYAHMDIYSLHGRLLIGIHAHIQTFTYTTNSHTSSHRLFGVKLMADFQ